PLLRPGAPPAASLAWILDTRRGVSRGDRRRSALRRYGAFRPPRLATRLARPRLPCVAVELFRAGRAAARGSRGARKPVLPAFFPIGGVSPSLPLFSTLQHSI